ncbi:MAG TPA: hypothetical protein VFK41_09870 [Nocardioidaceae bacterium]|nr:hypothetical protein [Nocardioidaceae bacterium]
MTSPSRTTIERIVAAACRAPSVHNSQPWRWRYDGERLDLFADWDRQIRTGDPAGRDLEISCGAALHHAVVAAAAEGLLARVTRVPDALDSTHLASLRFTPTNVTVMAETTAEAIYARHTDRREPSSTPVPDSRLQDLALVAAAHGAFVTAVRVPEDHAVLTDLRQLSALLQHDDDHYFQELSRWTHSTGDDGVPDTNVLFAPPEQSRYSAMARFPSGTLRDAPEDGGDPAPSWLLVATSSDDTLSRLRAGEALSAMSLLATLHGLSLVPFTQPVEVDVTRTRMEERVLSSGTCLQLVLRVGVPPAVRARVPMTRRRPVHDVLTQVEVNDVRS